MASLGDRPQRHFEVAALLELVRLRGRGWALPEMSVLAGDLRQQEVPRNTPPSWGLLSAPQAVGHTCSCIHDQP